MDPKEKKQARRLAKPHGEKATTALKVFEIDFASLPRHRVGEMSWRIGSAASKNQKKKKKKKHAAGGEAMELEGLDEDVAKKRRAAMETLKITADAFKGAYPELVRQRFSSKVMQTLLKYGSEDQKATVCSELKGHWKDVSMDKFGHMVLLKVLYWGSPQQRIDIHSELQGSYRKLCVHNVSAKLVDLIYASSMESDTGIGWSILHELISNEFRVLKPVGLSPLKDILEEKEPARAGAIKKDCLSIISKAFDKNCVTRPIIALIKQYWEAVGWKEKDDLLIVLRAQASKLRISSDGAEMLNQALAYGSAKNRKAIVKSFKEHVGEMALDPDSCVALLRAMVCVDDTKLLKEQLVVPLLSTSTAELAEICTDSIGHLAVVQLLVANSTSYVPKHMLDRLQPVQRPNPKKDNELAPTTKKPQEKRRAELAAAALPGLLDFVEKDVHGLATDEFGCRVLEQVVLTCSEVQSNPEDHLSKCLGEGERETTIARLQALVKSIAKLSVEVEEEDEDDDDDDDDEEAPSPLAEDRIGHRLLKRLVKAKVGGGDDAKGDLGMMILEAMEGGMAEKWTRGNRSAFVLSAILEFGSEAAKKRLLDLLKPLQSDLQNDKNASKGTKVLVKCASSR